MMEIQGTYLCLFWWFETIPTQSLAHRAIIKNLMTFFLPFRCCEWTFPESYDGFSRKRSSLNYICVLHNVGYNLTVNISNKAERWQEKRHEDVSNNRLHYRFFKQRKWILRDLFGFVVFVLRKKAQSWFWVIGEIIFASVRLYKGCGRENPRFQRVSVSMKLLVKWPNRSFWLMFFLASKRN